MDTRTTIPINSNTDSLRATTTRAEYIHDQQSSVRSREGMEMASREKDLEQAEPPAPRFSPKRFGLAVLAAVGVIYGDIGTSPLYTYSTVLAATNPPSDFEILSTFGLIFWCITLTTTFKYIIFILSADLNGEGGVFVLYQLLQSKLKSKRLQAILLLVAAFGVCLLFADGVLTPGVSVYSAISGLTVQFPTLSNSVLTGITCAILVLLFACERFGSSKIGWSFGPIVTLWFITIFCAGCYNLSKRPEIWKGVNPYYAFTSLGHTFQDGKLGIIKLGDVFLALTGSEACYADIGHFGKNPVRFGWAVFVYPALIIQYAGQGSMLLENPDLATNSNLFFYQLPGNWIWWLLIISTLATIFASQAMISGAFSTFHQAIMLDMIPPLRTLHTNAHHYGQVYIPVVNFLLMILCVVIVGAVQSAGQANSGLILTAAYGVSVSGSFVCTTILFLVYLKVVKEYPFYVWVPFMLTFGTLDLLYLIGSCAKVPGGGWISLTIAGVMFLVMLAWKWGRVQEAAVNPLVSSDDALHSLLGAKDATSTQQIVPNATGIFLCKSPTVIPQSIFRYAAATGQIPENIVMVTFQSSLFPFINETQRFEVTNHGQGVYRVVVHVGFAEGRPYLDQIYGQRLLATDEMKQLQNSKGVFIFSNNQLVVDVVELSPRTVGQWAWEMFRSFHLAAYHTLKRTFAFYDGILKTPESFLVVNYKSRI